MTPMVEKAAEIEAKRRRLQRIRRREWTALAIILALVLLFGLNFKLVQVEGRSMAPTFRNGETVLLWRTASMIHPYKVGDVIVFEQADGSALIKRICFIQKRDGSATMPDALWTPQGYVAVGDLLNSTGRISFPRYEEQIAAARRGIPVRRTLYVMGDNTWDSEDSRDFGPVAPEQVMGVVIGTVHWPLFTDCAAAGPAKRIVNHQ